MTGVAEHADLVWSLLVYTGVVLGLIAFMLASAVLGERHSTPMGDMPYESGMIPVGSARLKFSAKFYLVAIFFVLFDLEAVFVFAWAVAAREAGWLGYIEVMVFLGILTLALVYAWRTGALDWAPKTPRERFVRQRELRRKITSNS